MATGTTEFEAGVYRAGPRSSVARIPNLSKSARSSIGSRSQLKVMCSSRTSFSISGRAHPRSGRSDAFASQTSLACKASRGSKEKARSGRPQLSVSRRSRGSTDASVLVEARPDLPVVVCGPGDDRLAHQPNAWVSKEAFEGSIAFYERLATAYFR